MAFSVVVPIIASALTGVGAILTYILIFFRPGGSTQALRGGFAAAAMFALAMGWGAVALRQPISNPTGSKEVHWGHRTSEAVAMPLIAATVALGIFSSFGIRVMIPVITAGAFIAMAVGPFVLGGFAMWFWLMVACVFLVLLVLTFFLADRLDVVSEELRGHHASMPGYPGLLWRILTPLSVAVYILFLGLSPDFGVVMNVTTMYILYGVLDCALGVYVFLNWILVTSPAEPIYDASNIEASRETARPTSAIGAPLVGKKQTNGARNLANYAA